MTDLTEQLARLRARIENAARVADRDPAEVRLVAVSKTRSADEVLAVAAAGQRDFGENRLQEALDKIAACRQRPLCWHFIGQLQANKTRQVAEHFDWVHSLDRLRIARRLSEQRPAALAPLNVCLQVDLGGETQKAGVAPEAASELAHAVAALPRLRLRGLMCLPPAPDAPGDSRPYFRRLRELCDTLRAEGLDLDTLSMGMTADLEDAIAEGATLVRVGTALFGTRNP